MTSPKEALQGVISGNINSLIEARARFERRKTLPQKVADRIAGFAGSMTFVLIHVVLFGGWIIINCNVVSGLRPFDPFPFVMLAMWASVEAIFLSTFVLISQNRMAELSDRRADLDLQINLLSEREITTVLSIVDAIAAKLDVGSRAHGDVGPLKEKLMPEAVLDALDAASSLVEHPETTVPVGKAQAR